MNRTREQFSTAYEQGLTAHLVAPGEPTLHAAYELGRSAVAEGLGVLDLAQVHNDLLVGVLGRPTEDPARVVAVAGDFFAESLAAHEMVRRGYREAHDAATLERRHAETIRHLSSFLADTSLASDATGTLGEALQLIAEHARELVEARACIVATRANKTDPWTTGSSPAQLVELLEPHRHAQFLGVHALLQAEDRAVRFTREQLRRHPIIAALPRGDSINAWMGVPMKALDDHLLGWIQLFEWEHGEPSDLDEALIVHLGQIAAATLERTRLYRQ